MPVLTDPRLISIATAVPPHVMRQGDIAAAGSSLFAGVLSDEARRDAIYANAAINRRYSCVPLDWYLEPHGFADRNALYLEHALALSQEAANEALARAGLAADEIDAIVSVSSSGIATPSLDALLMERMPFRRDVQRLPIFGLGCAGGVLGLARAAGMARSQPGTKVLLLVVELCGLTFRLGDRSKSNLIATALFGDGVAAAIVGDSGTGPRLTHWGEHTWPGSLDVMGWRVADDGFGVLFSRDIPSLIRSSFRTVAEDVLRRFGLTLGDIDTFLCHPGGAKVIDALEEALGLQRGGLVDSRAVLSDYGNMSAATVLFVLERAMTPACRGRMLLSSLGPGFTAGFLVAHAD
ncbi:MAG: type III polyketide synthase [Alphaproteobacteria bacterium]|nr:type III polyketide synthase [Alphaproteobacteria bacterium]